MHIPTTYAGNHFFCTEAKNIIQSAKKTAEVNTDE